MKLRLTLLATIVCVGFSLTCQAADISETITGGTFSPSGTFSGSFLFNTTSQLIDGGQITAIAPGGGTTYNFFNAANDSSTPGLALFTDSSGDAFRLAINGAGGLNVNTLAAFGINADTELTIPGARFDATGATIATTTPEPSSLILLGTGALGLLGSFRRRLLKA